METDAYPAFLIPTYQPNEKLVQLIKAVRESCSNQRIIVVDDGSDAARSAIFSKILGCNIELLRHPKNQGKGQALKTGLRYWLETSSPGAIGIVTADADGQHLPQDILHIATAFRKHPLSLYLGVRRFDKYSTPWRSRFGNKLTAFVSRLFITMPLQDTQTGLRAIPRKLMATLLKSNASGYDFELEMLLTAGENKITIQQIPIHTVYLNENNNSHFNPLIDSVKIYFVFIRFAAISLISAVIDFTIFSFMYGMKKNIFLAVSLGRILSATFNFILNHHLTFKSENKPLPAAIKYASLVSCLGLIACCLITLIHDCGVNIYSSKIIAEIALFILSFSIQRFFIFNKSILLTP